MNYIHKLQHETAAQAREINALRKGINELRRHLTSEKFHDDRTIQVQDVEDRLLQIMFGASDAAETDPAEVSHSPLEMEI
jgi:hypothetical protein